MQAGKKENNMNPEEIITMPEGEVITKETLAELTNGKGEEE